MPVNCRAEEIPFYLVQPLSEVHPDQEIAAELVQQELQIFLEESDILLKMIVDVPETQMVMQLQPAVKNYLANKLPEAAFKTAPASLLHSRLVRAHNLMLAFLELDLTQDNSNVLKTECRRLLVNHGRGVAYPPGFRFKQPSLATVN